MSFQIVPLRAEEKPAYLAGLNSCFQNWGGEEQFNWVFRRDAGAGPAELLLAKTPEGEICGGTAVSFRRVSNLRGVESKIAIMTGSWVLPVTRGKGCFTDFIQASLSLAEEAGCSLLTAFCFTSNKSHSRLVAAGCTPLETAYFRDPKEYLSREDLPVLESLSAEDRSSELLKRPAGHAGFLYHPEQWKEQFLHGPYPKAYLELAGRSTALVEEAHGFFRVLSLSLGQPGCFPEVLQSLWEIARRRHQRLFLFAMPPEMIKVGREMGLEEIPGAFNLKVACRAELAKWVGSTKTLNEEDLVNPESPAYLGPWWIQNRDRM